MAQVQEPELRINYICISRDGTLQIGSLLIKSESDLGDLKKRAASTAHVLRIGDADRICLRFGNLIRDCGVQGRAGGKRQTLQLSRLVPHGLTRGDCEAVDKKIDLIRTSYQKEGRTVQGIVALLNKSWAGPRLFFIAVNDAIFDALIRRAQSDRAIKFSHPVFLQRIPDNSLPTMRFRGSGPEYVRVRKQIQVAAISNLSVLIQGESGTGKELVAEAIHDLSSRAKTGEFVAVDCGAISPNLLEGELFGVEPGMLAGVPRTKLGMWEQADKGTLFLDEIGNMSIDHQARVLRALSSRVIRRVGGLKARRVDVRIIAATNKDLMAMIARGEFLGDLYYRISGIEIFTPALPQTPAGLKEFARHEWRKIRENDKAFLPAEIIEELPKFTALSNYRGLQNALGRLNAYMLAEGLEEADRRYFLKAMEKPPRKFPVMDATVSKEDAATYRAECLRNLRQAARCVRQCKVILRPVLRDSEIDGNGFDRILDAIRPPHAELDKLCLDPTAFYSHEIHSELSKFAGFLSGLVELMTRDGKGSHEYWEKNLQSQYELVLTLMQYEIKGLDRP